MTQIRLPGDNRAVDGQGYWIRAWHAVLETLTRNLATAETTIETHAAQIAAINTALADNDIEVTAPVDEETETPTPEPEPEPEETDGWQIAIKAESQEMVSVNGYFDDPDLQFSIAEDESFAFRLVAHWQTENSADIQWRMNGPTGPAMLQYLMTDVPNDNTRIDVMRDAYAVSRNRGSDQARGTIEIDGVVTNGATGGIVVFQWGPDANTGNITRMLKGSYLEYRKIT